MAADVNELIKAITADVKTIVKAEVELAKSQLIPSGKNAGIGVGLFSGAGYFGLNALSLFFMAGGFGLACLFEALLKWPVTGAAALGFTIMAVLLLIFTAILALVGKGRLQKVKGPELATREAELTLNQTSRALAAGVEDVNSGRSFERYLVEKTVQRAERDGDVVVIVEDEPTAS